ncbi:MAG: exodeoxyribonuclease VII small subunit [Melioribacteraceae bacterium]|jgi:exodeoxyribonuclease VII small subunit|nr:exodeoxyribonuclease VII small subunit [Melioribacteraceae bacterium]
MAKKKENNFEENVNRLQEISDLLENPETGLEDSIKLYEEGINLAKICYDTLKSAELKITELKQTLETKINFNE